jgi:hypothetical protein
MGTGRAFLYVGKVIVEGVAYDVFKDQAGDLYRKVEEGAHAHYEMLEDQGALIEPVQPTGGDGEPVAIGPDPGGVDSGLGGGSSIDTGPGGGVIIDTPPRPQPGGGADDDPLMTEQLVA